MYRRTNQRKKILDYLRSTTSHPTADEIYDAIRLEMPGVSKGTIYRNLKVLQQQGHVKEISLNGQIGRYEFDCGNHYHFKCDSCGKVMDIDEPVHTELEQRIAGRTGLKITSHQMEFRGLCIACQQKYNNQSEANYLASGGSME